MSVDMTEKQDQVTGQSQLVIQKIYLKDASFEAKGTPHVFQQQWEPQVELELSNGHTLLAEEVHEVELRLTVTTRLQDAVAFLVEVHMAGIFTIQDFPQDEMKKLLGVYCPDVIYPYAREVISDLVVKGGFPQLILSPINFDAIYRQSQEQEASGVSASAESQKN